MKILAGLRAMFVLAVIAAPAVAQDAPATVRVRIAHAGEGVAGVVLRLGSDAASTDREGRAVLRAPAGARTLHARRLGLAPDSIALTLRAGQDTSVTLELEELDDELAGVVVSATRSERRVQDEAVRVEVLEKEEIDEKVMMTPGDVTMLLNETSGLRVQVTSPSLGGAGVRIQGLGPRYTQILSDGLPLYGGQSGGLSLLQIPPVDLGRVEVIKGSASAMYGAQALGGVINFVSRRAQDEAVRELLLNQTSRGGTDAVFFGARPFDARWSGSLLAGAHRQDRADIDDDGWADLAGYERFVARPRLFREGDDGSSLFITSGVTLEDRRGGTMAGRTAPDGGPYVEGLDTRRGDLGAVARVLLGRGDRILNARLSLAAQEHHHRFGARAEFDRHRTAFGEVTHTTVGARATWLGGLALQHDDYRNSDVPRGNFDQTLTSAFAQGEMAVSAWLTLSAAARVDVHEEYGTSLNPRLSALLRAPGSGSLEGWTLRLSAASGVFAPTILTDETEVVGIDEVELVDPLRFERAATASVDVGGRIGVLEVNATLFASRVTDPLRVIGVPSGNPFEHERLHLMQSARPSRTHGGELVARYLEEPWHVTASYTAIDATEWDDAAGRRVAAALTPRHAVGLVAMHEWDETARVGLEFYYTGAQALEGNPYRDESPAYVIVGALVERAFGPVRVFVNFENLTDARQTRTDPVLLPARGRGGRWTTDVWSELAGRTVNGGVRWGF
jgi:outer membrane receptor for ferrienterochelin and colicins